MGGEAIRERHLKEEAKGGEEKRVECSLQNEKTKYAKAWRQDSQDWVLIPTRDPVELKQSVLGQRKQVMRLQGQELHIEGLGTQDRGLEI